MITWGINALNHDASIAVVENGSLKFWRRSSEYSQVKGDPLLNGHIIKEALNSTNGRGPNNIAWYEQPWLKKTRQLRAGQYRWAFDLNELPSRYLKNINLTYPKISYYPHHKTHAAAGYFTSPFEDATVIVLDAMGEWESSTIWSAKGNALTKVWSRSYPTSLGLFYSAFTDLIGMKPVAEEHLLQKMSSQGESDRYYGKVKNYWRNDWTLRVNLHRGVRDWVDAIETDQDRADIAAAVQRVFEEQAQEVITIAHLLNDSPNLVYMGGCAMNSQFNSKMVEQWQGVWSLPVPGDAASSIGAALLDQSSRITWKGELPRHLEVKCHF
jgi:carbamoyltransferase